MQHRAETGAQAAGLNPRSLLNHSPGRKTGFSTPLPNLALAHFSNFSLAILTLLPLPGGLSLPSSGRPSSSMIHSLFLNPKNTKVSSGQRHAGIRAQWADSLPKSPPTSPTPLRAKALPSCRRRPSASLRHQEPGEDRGAGSRCFTVLFPLRPSAGLPPPSATCQERDLISHLRARGCCYFCLME